MKGPQDTIPFHPYYTVKDLFGLGVFLIIFAYFVFYNPNYLGHPDNYIPADPLQDAAAHRAGVVSSTLLRDSSCHSG